MTAGDGPSRRSSVLSLIQRHVEAFNDRDVERLCAGFAPHIVFVTGKDTVSGMDAVRDFFADAFSGSAQLRLEIRSSVVEGDLAACELRESITIHGQTHHEWIAAFYTVRDGGLTKVKVYREGSADIDDL